jgi:hypothetical protein
MPRNKACANHMQIWRETKKLLELNVFSGTMP